MAILGYQNFVYSSQMRCGGCEFDFDSGEWNI